MNKLSDMIIEDCFMAFAESDVRMSNVIKDARNSAKMSWGMRGDKPKKWDALEAQEQHELILQELRK